MAERKPKTQPNLSDAVHRIAQELAGADPAKKQAVRELVEALRRAVAPALQAAGGTHVERARSVRQAIQSLTAPSGLDPEAVRNQFDPLIDAVGEGEVDLTEIQPFLEGLEGDAAAYACMELANSALKAGGPDGKIQARAMAALAIEKTSDPELLSGIGDWVLSKEVGQQTAMDAYAKAVEHLKEGHLTPQDRARIAYHMGNELQTMGAEDLARRAYQVYVKFNEDEESLRTFLNHCLAQPWKELAKLTAERLILFTDTALSLLVLARTLIQHSLNDRLLDHCLGKAYAKAQEAGDYNSLIDTAELAQASRLVTLSVMAYAAAGGLLQDDPEALQEIVNRIEGLDSNTGQLVSLQARLEHMNRLQERLRPSLYPKPDLQVRLGHAMIPAGESAVSISGTISHGPEMPPVQQVCFRAKGELVWHPVENYQQFAFTQSLPRGRYEFVVFYETDEIALKKSQRAEVNAVEERKVAGVANPVIEGAPEITLESKETEALIKIKLDPVFRAERTKQLWIRYHDGDMWEEMDENHLGQDEVVLKVPMGQENECDVCVLAIGERGAKSEPSNTIKIIRPPVVTVPEDFAAESTHPGAPFPEPPSEEVFAPLADLLDETTQPGAPRPLPPEPAPLKPKPTGVRILTPEPVTVELQETGKRIKAERMDNDPAQIIYGSIDDGASWFLIPTATGRVEVYAPVPSLVRFRAENPGSAELQEASSDPTLPLKIPLPAPVLDQKTGVIPRGDKRVLLTFLLHPNTERIEFRTDGGEWRFGRVDTESYCTNINPRIGSTLELRAIGRIGETDLEVVSDILKIEPVPAPPLKPAPPAPATPPVDQAPAVFTSPLPLPSETHLRELIEPLELPGKNLGDRFKKAWQRVAQAARRTRADAAFERLVAREMRASEQEHQVWQRHSSRLDQAQEDPRIGQPRILAPQTLVIEDVEEHLQIKGKVPRFEPGQVLGYKLKGSRTLWNRTPIPIDPVNHTFEWKVTGGGTYLLAVFNSDRTSRGPFLEVTIEDKLKGRFFDEGAELEREEPEENFGDLVGSEEPEEPSDPSLRPLRKEIKKRHLKKKK